jgi:hypothetical protein
LGCGQLSVGGEVANRVTIIRDSGAVLCRLINVLELGVCNPAQTRPQGK